MKADLTSRVARLEARASSDPLMTAAEIDQAATIYSDRLAEPHSDGPPIEAWRCAIISTRLGWLQRSFAAMHPADWGA